MIARIKKAYARMAPMYRPNPSNKAENTLTNFSKTTKSYAIDNPISHSVKNTDIVANVAQYFASEPKCHWVIVCNTSLLDHPASPSDLDRSNDSQHRVRTTTCDVTTASVEQVSTHGSN